MGVRLKNEQGENFWLQRAMKENKRKLADGLSTMSRLQEGNTDVKEIVLSKFMQSKAIHWEQQWINLDAFDINQGLQIV